MFPICLVSYVHQPLVEWIHPNRNSTEKWAVLGLSKITAVLKVIFSSAAASALFLEPIVTPGFANSKWEKYSVWQCLSGIASSSSTHCDKGTHSWKTAHRYHNHHKKQRSFGYTVKMAQSMTLRIPHLQQSFAASMLHHFCSLHLNDALGVARSTTVQLLFWLGSGTPGTWSKSPPRVMQWKPSAVI